MDVGGWLRGLGLGQYEALFRASDIDANILPTRFDPEELREEIRAYQNACSGVVARHLTRCEPAPLHELAELFLREVTAQPDCPEALVGHRISGVTCWYFGDYAEAHEHYRKSIQLYDPARHGDFANRFGQDPRAQAEVYDAIALWVLGRIDEALRLAECALASADAAAHVPTRAFVLAHRALLGPFTAPSRCRCGRWPNLSRHRL
jgi:tetratricopeptide (TPR) repeat protein